MPGVPAHATANATPEMTSERELWPRLHAYEAQALRDYSWRSIEDAMLTRSEELWTLHLVTLKSARLQPCAVAARTLSMMVRGIYFSSRQGEIPDDWFHFAPGYAESRTACMKALDVDEREFTLPGWFGR